MTDSASLPDRRLAFRLRLARTALWWERVWPACWPAVSIIGVFVVLGLFDLLPMLPGLAHVGILAVLAGGLIVAIVLGGRAIVAPDTGAARRRVEQASGLSHRPLQALADRPSIALDPEAAGLWEAHRQRMADMAKRLRVGWPAAGLARRDPWGLRAVLAMLLVIGAVDAGADWLDRLARAAVPSLGNRIAIAAPSLDIWVTPPEYTGLAPQFLQSGSGETIHIPTGSKLLAQIHGAGANPHLTIDGKAQAFDAVDSQNFRVAATLTAGKTLAVTRDGATLGSWPIEIVPDLPPKIAFASPPSATPHAALRLDFKAADDYGVESVKAVIRRQGGNPAETIDLDLPLPGLHLKEADATSYHDLSPHPWAGLPVEIRMTATDALGQTGQSETVKMILPERVFKNPLARAIIDQRKELAKDPRSAVAVSEILGDLNARPALYGNDTVIYLALATAAQRLSMPDAAAAVPEIEQVLWDAALRIEDGRMSLAEREMRQLQQQLQDALAKNAPDAEIDRLTRELQQALDRYMQALAEELKRHPEQAVHPVDPSRVVSSRDLQRMIDRARDLARNGDRDQARQLLSQLQNMLENLRTAQPGQQGQNSNSQAQQMMRDMRDLMQRQQQLLDRSFRAQNQAQMGQRGQRGQPGPQNPNGQPSPDTGGDQADNDPADNNPNGGAAMGDAAGQQEELRRTLGDMMRKLGENGDIPQPFGRAERAMRDAGEALQRSQPGQAIGPQTEALDQLQQAARDVARQMQQQMGGAMGEPGSDGMGASDREQRDQVQRDPLGRPTSNDGTYDQGDVKIPDDSVLQKSRQILDELRRRSGDRTRPPMELDYIDRLLKRF